MKIVLAFLVLSVLGNLGLTLYLHSAHEREAFAETTIKDAKAIDEMAHIRDELVRARANLATTMSEVSRLKVEYATVIAQVGAVSAPHVAPYSNTFNSSVVTAGAETKPSVVQPEHAGGKVK